MQSDAFLDLTQGLRELGGQRVWSLMISLFGDLAQAKGEVIDGPVLTAMMNMLAVKPEATRVALHRLRNDGWITSRKSGRISQHGLTSKGRAECAAASPRIYGQPHEVNNDWQVIVLEDDDPDVITEGFVRLTNRIFIGPCGTSAPKNTLRLTGDIVPSWLVKQLEPTELREDYTALVESLRELSGKIPHATRTSPLETAALRCLIVHNWRRLLLKHPQLPASLISPDWPGLHCHVLVAQLLRDYPRPALHDITPEMNAA